MHYCIFDAFVNNIFTQYHLLISFVCVIFYMGAVTEFGFGVPLVTAGNTRDSVDFEGTRKIWDYLIPELDVAVVLGTTGWGRNVLAKSRDDARRLVDLGIELGEKHGKKVVVGTGAEKLEHAVEITEYAASKGVFGVLVTDPIHRISEFAQGFGQDPVDPAYLHRIMTEYHCRVMDAIPERSGTIYMPYIFPQLTAGNTLGFPAPEHLKVLINHAEMTGKKMDGGKLTHEDKVVAQIYAKACPELTFQAGFDHRAKLLLADPGLNFNGAIFGTGNLIPKFLGAHVRDCLRLRELRVDDPTFQQDETASLLNRVSSQQSQVDAMFAHMWDTPGAFPRLIHGTLGIGEPTHVPEIPQNRLEQLALGIARDAPALAREMTQYQPEAPLAKVMVQALPEMMDPGGQMERPFTIRGQGTRTLIK
ncbi:MAG: hypothetical protein GF416_03110 [Candidatus Altiarchaeales archaeon]|nr:hypothetical protein [Candidatus Altiarchaeales archaeon]MBD3416110.1 hypothetical protein [Candidatus Altiarchaeales archaeon]